MTNTDHQGSIPTQGAGQLNVTCIPALHTLLLDAHLATATYPWYNTPRGRVLLALGISTAARYHHLYYLTH